MRIEKLSVYYMPDRKHVPDGYDMRSVPEATPANMEVLMNKINEIIDVVNTSQGCQCGSRE